MICPLFPPKISIAKLSKHTRKMVFIKIEEYEKIFEIVRSEFCPQSIACPFVHSPSQPPY
jgi:hypothetical protein